MSNIAQQLSSSGFTSAQMLEVYNRYAEEPLKNFRDRKQAIERTAKVMQECGITMKNITNEADNSNEEVAAKEKPVAKKKEVVAEKPVEQIKEQKKEVPKYSKNYPGPISWMTGKKIKKVTEVNPYPENTHKWRSWNIARNGMGFEEYLEAKGRTKDLNNMSKDEQIILS